MVTKDLSNNHVGRQGGGGDPFGVAVGVTGHRVLAAVDSVSAGVSAALSDICEAFPGRQLTIVSSLAEGADRLAARVALERYSARLVVVLPVAEAAYETDFHSGASRKEFRDLLRSAAEIVRIGETTSRDSAYEAAGLEMLRRSDALITIWDGEGTRGRGGTGAVVERARQMSLPIAWVHAGNRSPQTGEPVSMGVKQGSVTFENF